MPSRGTICLVAGALALAACSSDEADGEEAAATTADATAATTAATAVTTAPVTTAPPTTPAPTTAPATTAPPTTEAPAELEIQGFGQYEVGVQTITIDPTGERPLTVDVWFPLADGAEAALAPQQYTLLPGVFYESPNAFAATPDLLAGGPFPLVVYSHGSGGLRFIHAGYTEILASHGYVVAAPDHTGNTVFERFAGALGDREVLLSDRPADVRRVIDAMVDPANPTAGPIAAQVDPERIAVTGHSFGGYTSVATVTGFSNAVATAEPDERVDAIALLAPALDVPEIDDARLAGLDVPFIVVVGSEDTATPIEPNVTRLWDLSTVTPAYRVELAGGEHQSFTDMCAYQRALPLLENVPEIVVETINDFAEEACAPEAMTDTRLNGLTATYVLDFLAEVFDGGDPITAAAPDDVVFQSR